MKKVVFACIVMMAWGIFLTSFVLAQSPNQEESITLTTYYPAPYGVYKDLEAKDGLAVGDITTGTGVLNVGDLHQGELWVEKGLILNPQDLDPADADSKTGEVIYNKNDKVVKVFDGFNWSAVGQGGGSCFTYYCGGVGGNVCENKNKDKPDEPDDFCPAGFKQGHYIGKWGYCGAGALASNYAYFCPPGGQCLAGGTADYVSVGDAYLCCQK
ncbi:MAG: hypothetical protein PHU64_00810 [Candidatus Omnitrophica bacterium]|nr:hypothetical protein [Candidatus Omnitrophota bacterium]MDD5430340.1 hypothetical protein [Candidatus Omnitrophota bacterium]